MTKFLYSAFLPSINRSVGIKEFKFSDYKQLVKLIHNDNNTYIDNAFNKLIKDLVIDTLEELTFLDKLILLLTIRSVCVFPTLELTLSNPKTQQLHNFVYEISKIIDSISDPRLFNTLNSTVVDYGNIQITYGIPEDLYYDSEESVTLATIKRIIINKKNVTEFKSDIIQSLPALILKDAKKHVKLIEDNINKLSLLSIKTNFSDVQAIEFNPSIISDTTLEFLKLLFKKELTSLYELEYFLTSKLSLPFSVVANSTLAELNIYIRLYNEERKEQNKENKQQNHMNPLAAR